MSLIEHRLIAGSGDGGGSEGDGGGVWGAGGGGWGAGWMEGGVNTIHDGCRQRGICILFSGSGDHAKQFYHISS